MKQNQTFFRTVCTLAIPVALQSMLQSSFSIVDQIMIGQLGSVSVAGVGLAGKFSSIYSVVVSAIGAVAGILIAQYLGQQNRVQVRKSFWVNLLLAGGLAVGFAAVCFLMPHRVMGLYSGDEATVQAAGDYLFLLAGTFLPIAGATLLSTLYRCMEKASLPLYASIGAALLNTGLNYLLIFGKWGFAPMGAKGAAIATVISQWGNLLIMLLLLIPNRKLLATQGSAAHVKFRWKQYALMLLPVLVCEFAWSLGENVYAAIYGNMSTNDSAAMTLLNPIQGLMTGSLCGLSQAAGVIIGKRLGSGEHDKAYAAAKKLLCYGLIGSLVLSALVVLLRGWYVQIYRVEPEVRQLTQQIMLAYALIAPFKVQNMILGGGILRSGGKTQYVMGIDMLGTWVFGVPLGLLSAFVWKLPIACVYFILSLEECVRFAVSLIILRRKKWMQSLKG